MKYVFERGQKISNWESCPCGNKSEMYCICEGTYDTREHDSESSEYAISHYKVLRCPSCEQILILRYVTGGIDLGEPESRYVDYERQVLYTPSKPRHHSIPSVIADVVAQAEKVIPTSPRAGFILCRAALEQICEDHNISGRNLKKRLDTLLEISNLSDDLREIMHGIRDIGNKLAHNSQESLPKEISQDEAEILIGLVDYVLNRLYVDKARTQEAINELNALKEKVNPNSQKTQAPDNPF